MRHYATACRGAELPVLLASMRRHCRPFVLHVLAWDFDPFEARMMGEPGAGVFASDRDDFLADHPDYAPERLPGPPRRPVDEVVTMRWRFYADVLEDTGEPLTCIDGDLHFFASPEPVFKEIGSAPFAVTPHGIPPRSAGLPGVTLETHARYGRHNAGFVYASESGPLAELAEACRLWSHTEVVERPGRRPLFGDQAHLEDIAERRGAHVIQAAVNVGPWGIHAKPLAEAADGSIYWGGERLIAYHFSSFRRRGSEQNADPHYEITPEHARILYEPYRLAWADGMRLPAPDHVEGWR